jgi:hypothetical protein
VLVTLFRRILVLVLLGSVVVLPGAVACGLIRGGGEKHCGTVDWAAWRRGIGEGKSPNTRQKIADTIISCHLLQGHTKPYVRARLGHPEGLVRSSRWRWITGPARGVPIDSEELVIEFSRGRVRNVHLEVG